MGDMMLLFRMNRCVIAVLSFLAVTLIATAANCQLGGDYDMISSTIDGGGGTSSGGGYVLRATIGQPDAGVASNGAFVLAGGFWPGGNVCLVTMEHFGQFAAEWLRGSGSPADLNGDGQVDIIDLAVFAHSWLSHCPGDWPF